MPPSCTTEYRDPTTCSVFLMLRRPTTPTLFPYTTLFRSPVALVLDLPDRERIQRRRACRFPAAQIEARMMPGDRKSTRLNSSHPSISYAVFCLKKKTNPGPAVTTPAREVRAKSARVAGEL